jgi:3-carboxy-cis,cis-muconate cycloisomerase
VSLFAPLFEPARLREALSARAWVEAMLEAEAALAAAQADAGVIGRAAADAIARASVDVGGLGDAALDAGNPVPEFVARLRAAVGEAHAADVHRGATSQDILDTAAMLVAQRARSLVVEELDGVAHACAALAREHRDTLMLARTLLQPALPTTFGFKAAGWLDAVLDARAGLLRARLDAQLGGAAGTLAALDAPGGADAVPGGATDAPGEVALAVAAGFAERLGLGVAPLPWHTARGRVAELGTALAIAAGAVGKVALDLVLLAQAEVGEAGAGAGGSSTLPQKQNPVGAIRARAAALRVPPLAALLLGAMAQEHERAAGAWHAEWEPLAQALSLTGGAAAALRETLEALDVRAERMRANLDAAGGALLAERVALALPADARGAVKDAALATDRGAFRDALLAQPDVAAHLDAAALDVLLDPAGYTGASGALIDRALDRAEREL